MSEREHPEAEFDHADAMQEQEPLSIDASDEEAASDADKVEHELEDLRSRLLRTTADYQNFVKRSQANQQAAVDQRVMSITRDLVTVIDHLDRALQLDAQTVSADDVMKGIASVRGEFLRVLGRHGVEPVEPAAGEPFDPNLHEALMRAEAEGVASDHVVAVLQTGYRLGDKPIRPAGVSVAP
ncbi:MAG: nucleotide exchange factor GrpE [Planctomycetota bacterium]